MDFLALILTIIVITSLIGLLITTLAGLLCYAWKTRLRQERQPLIQISPSVRLSG